MQVTRLFALAVISALLIGCSEGNPVNRTPMPDFECQECASPERCPMSCKPIGR